MPGMRHIWQAQALDHRPSPSCGEVRPAPDDLALSWLSCQSAQNACSTGRDASAPVGAVARAAPERPQADEAAFRTIVSAPAVVPLFPDVEAE